MAEFPLAVNVQGDYGYKVIVVDDDNTIEEVIQVADQIVGVLVAPFPDDVTLRARVHGAKQPLDNNLTVSDAGFIQMEALQIYAEG